MYHVHGTSIFHFAFISPLSMAWQPHRYDCIDDVFIQKSNVISSMRAKSYIDTSNLHDPLKGRSLRDE
jgi:hypothetical protein